MTRDRLEQLYCYLSLCSKISGNTYSLYMIFSSILRKCISIWKDDRIGNTSGRGLQESF